MDKAKWIIVIVVVMLMAFGLLSSYAYKTTADREINGLVVSREVFIKGCVVGATSDPEVFTETQKQDYCSCCYDRGTARWGGKEFTDKNLELERTDTLTPEMNELVNECVLTVL